MGYACPVCGDPQADADHLANHLAFTALARGGDHEAWLDEHVPDWGEMDETSLGERAVEHAEQTEFPQVFEDPGDHSHGHDHSRAATGGGEGHPLLDEARSRAANREFGDDTREVLEEARELTRKRRENAQSASGDDTETPDGSDAATDAGEGADSDASGSGSAAETADDSETE